MPIEAVECTLQGSNCIQQPSIHSQRGQNTDTETQTDQTDKMARQTATKMGQYGTAAKGKSAETADSQHRKHSTDGYVRVAKRPTPIIEMGFLR